jgi:hypothetical protein
LCTTIAPFVKCCFRARSIPQIHHEEITGNVILEKKQELPKMRKGYYDKKEKAATRQNEGVSCQRSE